MKKKHANDYWRAFDDWAMFNSTATTNGHINTVMGLSGLWIQAAKDKAQLPAWRAAIKANSAQKAYKYLSRKQRKTVFDFYGEPVLPGGRGKKINQRDLYNCYKWFGRSVLPKDPLRPVAPVHEMNGITMWFIWCSFADACLRSKPRIQPGFWEIEARAILIGALHDGLFRGRFVVNGFTADAAGSRDIVKRMKNLPAKDLQGEMAKRARESRLF